MPRKNALPQAKSSMVTGSLGITQSSGLDRHAVYARQRVDEFKDDDIASTQSARQSKDATDLVMEPDRQYAQLIRRLTPCLLYTSGWQLVPYTTDMAHEKVDAKLLGFKINDAQTNKTGDAETFTLSAPWTIAENDRLPINYDAVVSAVSQPVTEQDVLSVVFVLEWKGE